MPFALDYMTLKLCVWALVGLFLIIFALTDGFDFGIGTLLPFVARDDEDRRVVINTIGPIWEGQQVWLIAAGTTLFAAWPLAYATAFSALYLVLFLLLWTLFLRPVCFDYRSKLQGARWRAAWDWMLWVASFVPSIVFGAAFGNLFLGIDFHFDSFMRSFYTGTFWQLLHPFAVLCGLVSLCMLVMHGGYYLILRTEGMIAARARNAANCAAILFAVLFLLAGVWIAFGIEGYRVVQLSGSMHDVLTPLHKTVEKGVGLWLLNYDLYPWTKGFPILAVAGALASVLLSRVQWYPGAFICSGLTIIGTLMTAGTSLFPFIFPSSFAPGDSLTLWDAAAGAMSLNTIVWVNLLVFPVVMIYVTWVYRKLWGKVTVEKVREDSNSLY